MLKNREEGLEKRERERNMCGRLKNMENGCGLKQCAGK